MNHEHWAFKTLERPSVSHASAFPSARNAIDSFIGRRLRAKGLAPSEEADRRTLIRRLALDLNGLPPTPAEASAFDTSANPAAYERLVERIMASPRFGEMMAIPWLDAARYGDSSAMHADWERHVWAWRKYVIDAYNRNLPFDRFTIEQLAGDLLPGTGFEQQVASAFNRHHPTSNESGSIPEELRVEYVADRVHTTATVWLGLSLDCARCHDHKYDPISQKEYYRFFAYFNNSADPGMQFGDTPPAIKSYSDSEREKVTTLQRDIARTKGSVDAYRRRFSYRAEYFWEQVWRGERRLSSKPPGLGFHVALDNTAEGFADRVSGASPTSAPKLNDSINGDGILIRPDTQITYAPTASLRSSDPITISFHFDRRNQNDGLLFSRQTTTPDRRGFSLLLRDGKLVYRLVRRWPTEYVEVETRKPIIAAGWAHAFISIPDGTKPLETLINIDGKNARPRITVNALETDTVIDGPFHIGTRDGAPAAEVELKDIRIYSRVLERIELLPQYPVFHEAVKTPPEERNRLQKKLLNDYYFTLLDPSIGHEVVHLNEIERQLDSLNLAVGSCLVMGDQRGPTRPTFVLNRGMYNEPLRGQPVSPGVPTCLEFEAGSFPANRLGLARWIVDQRNPLTARVAVNRLWQRFFGTGLVSSPADFGLRGERPSHPELLDWLASEFIDSGWNMKHLVRLIVHSHTYRQSSRQKEYATDPANRLMARASRLRLPAESIRDQALALAGLLVEKKSGRSNKPYQPPRIWSEVHRYPHVHYRRDSGGRLYQRSIYSHWHRSAILPNMAIFDAPSRERCTVKRSRTNTPLQALVTLNDVQYVEAARCFAQRIVGQSNPDHIRLANAFELATLRPPKDEEIAILSGLLAEQRLFYQSDNEAAAALLEFGEQPHPTAMDPRELAAWTVVCQALLNLDEVLNRN